jgi:GTP-binding protein
MNNFEIKTAEFVGGIVGTSEILNDSVPQIAFVGRSNVGKSSLINSLSNRKDLARSSSKPGKTTEINFFLVNDAYYFVDLPGYGFAKTSQKQREKLRRMIVWYLGYGEVKPKKVVLIVDANVGLKQFDLEMLDLLRQENHDFLIVANKVDKIKKSKLEKQKKEILSQIGSDANVVFYSSKTGKGKNEVLEGIFRE